MQTTLRQSATFGNIVVYSFEYAGNPLEPFYHNTKMRYVLYDGLKNEWIRQSAGKN